MSACGLRSLSAHFENSRSTENGGVVQRVAGGVCGEVGALRDLCTMDSLSQIVLGAAVGEAVLGKKLGNCAMVWGAVAGTLPDMDVLGQFFLNELDNLAFHRGISHSLTATVLGSLFWGGLYLHGVAVIRHNFPFLRCHGAARWCHRRP